MAFNDTDTSTSDTTSTTAAQPYARDWAGRSTVAGLFQNRDGAQQAIQDLKAVGFTEDQIGVAMRDRNEQGQIVEETGVHGNHAGSGAATGAVVGGVLGLLVGIGALAIPGIGPIIAGGALAHAIGAGAAGVGIGAVSGGIVGALIGLGIPEHEARHFESGFNTGGTIVTVSAADRLQEATDILERDGGDTAASLYAADTADAFPSATDDTPDTALTSENVTAYTGPGDYARTRSSSPSDTDTDRKVELHAEELRASKKPVQTGEVTLRKEVITENRSIDVPVTREEVVIERHPVSGVRATGNVDFDNEADEVIRVPVMEEQVTVQKTPVVTEEISLGKRQVTETQHITDSVRHEEARIDNRSNVDVRQSNNAGLASEMDEDDLDSDVSTNRTNSQVR